MSHLQIAAWYFDGRSSRRHAVTLEVHDGVAVVSGEAERSCPIGQLRVSERLNRAARKVSFADGAYLEVRDRESFAALLHATGHRDGAVVRVQQNWRATLAATAGLILLVAVSYLYLLPLAAGVAARALPVSVDRQVGSGTLQFLDQHLLSPTGLPTARQKSIISRFAAMTTPVPDAPSYEIVFRKSSIGPNAFALPSGTIVVTDELVALLDDDDALMGVLAHELGHVHQRHMMRRLLLSSAVGAVATVLFGDVSAVLASVPAVLVDMKYSRDFEREADDYAIDMFRANGLPRQKLASVFEKLNGASAGKQQPAPYLSSHPSNAERIAHILGRQ